MASLPKILNELYSPIGIGLYLAFNGKRNDSGVAMLAASTGEVDGR